MILPAWLIRALGRAKDASRREDDAGMLRAGRRHARGPD